MIVWLASYPRSGNTLFRLALKHLCGIDTWSVYGDRDLVDMGAAHTVGHIGQLRRSKVSEASQAPQLYFVKTHGRPEDDGPAIHIVRDGRDALVSYAHYRINVNGVTDTYVEVLRDLVWRKPVFGGWSGHSNAWLGRKRTIIVRYEDMLQDVRGVLKMALAAVDVDAVVGYNMPEFGDLHNAWPLFFRRGKVGTWRNEMPPAIHRKFWERHGAVMTKLGYTNA